MSFLDKILRFMMLTEDDTPDSLIMMNTQRIEMSRRNDRILELSVRTDLERYHRSERQDYCLQLKFNESSYGHDFFMSCISNASPDSLKAIRNYLTNNCTPALGLIEVVVYFDRTILKFASIANPETEYSCEIDNRKGLFFSIEKPRETTSLYDCRFGEYDRISIAGQCHLYSGDNVAISYHLNSGTVYSEAVRPCGLTDLLGITDQSVSQIVTPPQYLLIEVTSFSQA